MEDAGRIIFVVFDDVQTLDAATYWCLYDELASFGAKPTGDRVVRRGKIITAAGVSSGIDMGLTLAGEIAGPEVAQAIQLAIEYDPQPPFSDRVPQPTVAMPPSTGMTAPVR